MSQTIQVIHGPNLNLLGEREPHIYGTLTLAEINQDLIILGQSLNVEVVCFQSNHEGELIDQVQECRFNTRGIIINPGGYGHTSIALRDALAAYSHPIIEVHLSNLYKRESFRHHSYLSPIVQGVICGLGANGYPLALRGLVDLIRSQPDELGGQQSAPTTC